MVVCSELAESSRCQDSGQGPDDCHNSSSQLMAAGCWQAAELAGNRPSGSETFGERQDEAEARRGGSCRRESPAEGRGSGAQSVIGKQQKLPLDFPAAVPAGSATKPQDLKCSSHDGADLEERPRRREHISTAPPHPSFEPCPSSLLSTCFPPFLTSEVF